MNHVMGNSSANRQTSSLKSVAESPQRPKQFAADSNGYLGQPWLVEERDACGVGFIADQQGRSSHDLVQKTLLALGCMEHRGGCSADRDSGDGAGIMTAVPWNVLNSWATSVGQPQLDPATTGVAMVFFPQDAAIALAARTAANAQFVEAGLTLVGWRVLPTKPDVLGVQARTNLPGIEQAIVTSTRSGDDLERQLYVARKKIGAAVESRDFYICSFSSRTIVYKGMVRSSVLGEFYDDLSDPSYVSNFSVYHRRFSTTTMP